MFFIPLLLTEAALKIGGAIAEHNAGKKAYKANVVAATDAAVTSQNALSAREFEERTAAGAQIEQATSQAVSASAMARLSALQAGVAGQSVDAVLRTIPADLGKYDSSVKQNLDLSLLQIGRQREGIDAERLARINSKAPPNPFVTGLQIGSALVDLGTSINASRPISTKGKP